MPGQRGGQQVWWKQIHHFVAWGAGWKIGGIRYRIWMGGFGCRGREGWKEASLSSISWLHFHTQKCQLKLKTPIRKHDILEVVILKDVLHLSSLCCCGKWCFELWPCRRANGNGEVKSSQNQHWNSPDVSLLPFNQLACWYVGRKNVKVMNIVRNDNLGGDLQYSVGRQAEKSSTMFFPNFFKLIFFLVGHLNKISSVYKRKHHALNHWSWFAYAFQNSVMPTTKCFFTMALGLGRLFKDKATVLKSEIFWLDKTADSSRGLKL